MTIKAIGYAYASSTIAARLGAARHGCYYVETKASELDTRHTSLRGPFETIEQAELHASAIACDWSRFTMRGA